MEHAKVTNTVMAAVQTQRNRLCEVFLAKLPQRDSLLEASFYPESNLLLSEV